MEKNKTRQIGSLNISHAVLVQLAKSVLQEVDGVGALVQPPKTMVEWLLQKKTAPLRLKADGGVAHLEVHVRIKAGYSARNVTEKIQQYLKEAVQNMTGIAVASVNVYVRGMEF